MFPRAPPAANHGISLRTKASVPPASAAASLVRRPSPALKHCASPRSFVGVVPAASTGVTYASDFRDLTVEQIDEEVAKCKRALFDLRVARATGKEIKTHEFRWNRKKVAQLLTVRRQKEIDQGITKRQSRRMEVKRLLAAGEMI